ncbi:MAG: exo-alpha-sialidase [Thaumarchaeota archaeon]|nr:exo-alpha-sialidase [Nitrososphaerota archaeon]
MPLFLLLLSGLPVVWAESEGSASSVGGYSESLDRSAIERGRNLLLPMGNLLSGASAFAVEGTDFRLFGSWSRSPGGSGTESGSPILQAASAALVPFRSPTQKFSRNVLLTRDYGQFPLQTEPSIAVNPKNPDHLVVGVIDYNFPNVVSYVTIDGGATWEGPFQPRYLQKGIGASGDPVVEFDRRGNVYISSISIGVQEFSIGGLAFQALISGIGVASSADGGFTWKEPTQSSTSTVKFQGAPVSQGIGGSLSLGFLDKPWMSAGPSRSDPSKDSVYVTYTSFVQKYDIAYLLNGTIYQFVNPVLQTTIEMVKSDDGGQTWSKPIAASPTVRRDFTGAANQRIVQGSQSAVAPDGTVYVSWFDSADDGEFKGLGEVWIARSDDGGASFSSPILVDTRSEIAFSPRSANFRAWGAAFPQIAVGPDGQVSLVYVARPDVRPTDDGDVFFTASSDNGESWSHPKRVNDDETSSFQFFPAVTYDSKGSIHVMWGDFRDDRNEKSYNIYYAKSADGGKTWTENARVTDFPSNPNRAFPGGRFIGDYFSIKASEKDVYMVWADGRLGEFGGSNQKIAYARASLMPSPSIFVNPPRGTGGRDVQIQGFNFQPNLEIFLEVSGAVVTSSRTDKDGRFALRIFMPIAGEGSQQITVFDASGNAATASFFMDVGFNTINQQLNQALDLIRNLTSQPAAPTSNSTSLDQLRDQLSSLNTSIWIATGLSGAAAVLATIAIILVLKRLPRK